MGTTAIYTHPDMSANVTEAPEFEMTLKKSVFVNLFTPCWALCYPGSSSSPGS